MKKTIKRSACVWLSLCLLTALVLPAAAEETAYVWGETELQVGENKVTAAADATTLYCFEPPHEGCYEVAVKDPAARLTAWYGSFHYVSQPSAEAVEGRITVTCTDLGQILVLGLSGVDSATVTVTEAEGYVPPTVATYYTYKNVHTPNTRFTMPDQPLTAIDITKTQRVVADADGIYHYGTVTGPVVYVNMSATEWTDLYLFFYPEDVEGEEWPSVDQLRGRYTETAGYEFLYAMEEYADALDDGYYYLTVDLAKYMRYYGTDQGWYIPRYSSFEAIQKGEFIEASAWLVNTYYVTPAIEPGDVNGDGRINNRDLALLQKYVNEWAVEVSTGADINFDGRINNRDLSRLQSLLNQ